MLNIGDTVYVNVSYEHVETKSLVSFYTLLYIDLKGNLVLRLHRGETDSH